MSWHGGESVRRLQCIICIPSTPSIIAVHAGRSGWCVIVSSARDIRLKVDIGFSMNNRSIIMVNYVILGTIVIEIINIPLHCSVMCRNSTGIDITVSITRSRSPITFRMIKSISYRNSINRTSYCTVIIVWIGVVMSTVICIGVNICIDMLCDISVTTIRIGRTRSRVCTIRPSSISTVFGIAINVLRSKIISI